MKKQETEITIAEWARRQGITRQAAGKRIRTLGIPRAPGGGVYEEEADAQVVARLDTTKRRGAPQTGPAEELNEARTRRFAPRRARSACTMKRSSTTGWW